MPPNNPPNAVFDVVSTGEDVPIMIDVQGNDSDPDGDPLTTNIVINALHGVAVVVNDSILYTPGAEYSGGDTIVYSVNDTTTPPSFDTTFVFITVNPLNDPPVATDDSLNVNEETSGIVAVLPNDSDIEGHALSTTAIVGGPFNGTAVINNDSIIYTPALNFVGKDSLYYQVCDNGIPSACDTGKVVICVANVNDPPVAMDDVASTNEDTPITIQVQGNDNDIDGDPLTTAIIAGPNNGGAALAGNDITYTPALNYFGPDTIWYSVFDNGTPSLGDSAMVILTVNPVNDAPVANPDTFTIANDTIGAGLHVIINDTDVEGNQLTITITCGPYHGSATVSGDSIIYTPDSTWYQDDTLCYLICDNGTPSQCDSAQVFIDLTGNNAPPVAVDDLGLSTTHADSINISVLNNDFDPDSNSISISGITCGPSNGVAVINGNQINYTPNQGFLGVDTFCYAICDSPFVGPPVCDTAIVEITVISDNLAPIAVDDSFTVFSETASPMDFGPNDMDPNVGDALTYAISIQPVNGTIAPLGNSNYSYQSNVGYIGLDSLQYYITDDGVPPLVDSAWVIITVIEDTTPVDTSGPGGGGGAGGIENPPTGFSPNGDGDNDNYVIQDIDQYPNNTFTVVNRWGAEVYSASPYNNEWDGTRNGNALPDGTYFFVLDLGDGSSPRSGFIILFR